MALLPEYSMPLFGHLGHPGRILGNLKMLPLDHPPQYEQTPILMAE